MVVMALHHLLQGHLSLEVVVVALPPAETVVVVVALLTEQPILVVVVVHGMAVELLAQEVQA
jgi:intracellular sulfur oxidation DsrE/DsrF family protein